MWILSQQTGVDVISGGKVSLLSQIRNLDEIFTFGFFIGRLDRFEGRRGMVVLLQLPAGSTKIKLIVARQTGFDDINRNIRRSFDWSFVTY